MTKVIEYRNRFRGGTSPRAAAAPSASPGGYGPEHDGGSVRHQLPAANAGAPAPAPLPAGGRDTLRLDLKGGRAALVDAWVEFIAPHFAPERSIYFTGTYSDEFGYPNGLMLPRNVIKDFRRELKILDPAAEFVVNTESHRDRSIRHLHAVIASDRLAGEFGLVRAAWEGRCCLLDNPKGRVLPERGWARALPVQDGCLSYVLKYVLKDDRDGDAMEWSWR